MRKFGATYHCLTLQEREVIEKLVKTNKYTFRQIGTIVGKSHSTISREVRNNSHPTEGYKATYAHEQYVKNISVRKMVLRERNQMAKTLTERIENLENQIEILIDYIRQKQ